MGLILIFLLIASMIGSLGLLSRREKIENAVASLIVSTLIFGIISLIALSVSYGSYVNLRTKYDATLEQYKSAVTMYVDHASIDIEKAAFTDFVYKGYQENVAAFIKDLREQIVKYNEGLISKRVMERNFIFSWIIIAPDEDMLIINMLEDVGAAKGKG